MSGNKFIAGFVDVIDRTQGTKAFEDIIYAERKKCDRWKAAYEKLADEKSELVQKYLDLSAKHVALRRELNRVMQEHIETLEDKLNKMEKS